MAKCRCKRGSGPLSSFLPGPIGMPLRFIGLGRKKKGSALSVSGNALRVSGNRMRGNGMWGDVLSNTIDNLGRAGTNELARLARRI